MNQEKYDNIFNSKHACASFFWKNGAINRRLNHPYPHSPVLPLVSDDCNNPNGYDCNNIMSQEVSCASSKNQPIDEPEFSEEDEMAEGEFSEDENSVEQHHDCDEYKSKIWNEAFGDPNAMTLANLTLQTVQEMSADEVCSDTIRSIYKTTETLATSENAQYSIRMFAKLLWSLAKKLDTESDKFKETSKVIRTVATDPAVQDLVTSYIGRTVDLIKDPVVRQRLFKMAYSVSDMIKPQVKKLLAAKRAVQNKRAGSFRRA